MPDTRLILNGSDLTVHTYQDVEDIVEENKAWQGDKQTGDFRKIASIPLNIINMWLHEEWERGNKYIDWNSPEFDALVKRKLADPDWAFLRTK
jgi:hypothetical protein